MNLSCIKISRNTEINLQSFDTKRGKWHIVFRDYLRFYPEAVCEYSRVKEDGAALYPYDMEKYIEHKSPFIERIYREIGI